MCSVREVGSGMFCDVIVLAYVSALYCRNMLANIVTRQYIGADESIGFTCTMYVYVYVKYSACSALA